MTCYVHFLVYGRVTIKRDCLTYDSKNKNQIILDGSFMDKNLALYQQQAHQHGLQTQYFERLDAFKVFIGQKAYYFKSSITPYNSVASTRVSYNRILHKRLIKEAGLFNIHSKFIDLENDSEDDVTQLLANLRYPAEIVPSISIYKRKSVVLTQHHPSLNLKKLKQLFHAHRYIHIDQAYKTYKHFKAIVLKDKLIGLIELKPAELVGDGNKNLQELHTKHMQEFPDVHTDHLYFFYDNVIPNHNEKLIFPGVNIHNTSAKTMNIHTDISQACRSQLIQALRVTGLDFGCIDFFSKNLTASNGKCYIKHMTLEPNILMFETPQEGTPQPISQYIIKDLIRMNKYTYLFSKLFKKHRNLNL